MNWQLGKNRTDGKPEATGKTLSVSHPGKLLYHLLRYETLSSNIFLGYVIYALDDYTQSDQLDIWGTSQPIIMFMLFNSWFLLVKSQVSCAELALRLEVASHGRSALRRHGLRQSRSSINGKIIERTGGVSSYWCFSSRGYTISCLYHLFLVFWGWFIIVLPTLHQYTYMCHIICNHLCDYMRSNAKPGATTVWRAIDLYVRM